MARISVEQKALTDPRFRLVGNALDVIQRMPRDFLERASGLLLAMLVWNECTERGVYKLKPEIVEAIQDGLVDALISADLAVMRGKLLRIKGTAGRTDWKAKQEENGRVFGPMGAEHGKKGGRPRSKKTPQGVSENPLNGLLRNPPLTPPTPTATSPPLEEEIQRPHFDAETWFTRFWEPYPRKVNKPGARIEWDRQVIDVSTAERIIAGLMVWKKAGEWRDPNFIPHPSTFLAKRQWEDKPIEESNDRHGRGMGSTGERKPGKVRSGLEGGEYDSIPDLGKAANAADKAAAG